MNLPTSVEKVNGSCQKSYIIILPNNHHLFPPWDSKPGGQTFASSSMILYKAEAGWTQKTFTAPTYETRFIKISLQVKNSRLTVHIYTHVQEGSSVSSFPGRSPSQPGQSPQPGNVSQIQQSSNHESVSATEASVLPLLRVPWFRQGNIANNHSHFTWF